MLSSTFHKKTGLSSYRAAAIKTTIINRLHPKSSDGISDGWIRKGSVLMTRLQLTRDVYVNVQFEAGWQSQQSQWSCATMQF